MAENKFNLTQTGQQVQGILNASKNTDQVLAEIQEAMADLPDGQAVSAQVALNTAAIEELSEKVGQGDGAYDISEANAVGGVLATYADLAAALGENGANIPADLRKGGMSVKFVQSSDNKYVQFRLISSSFNTIPANWQGVDDEPTAGSNNLVKSGGVADALWSYQALTVTSSVHNGYDTSGNPQSTLDTYFYSVSEGDVLKIIYNAFTSRGFSVIQAWNGDTFVESLLNSPTIGSGNILNYTVPQGVTKIGCSYFTNNVYLAKKITDDLYKKIADTNERVDDLSDELLVQTRNIWPENTTIVTTETSVVLGQRGVTLIPAGTYIMSFEVSQSGSSLGAEWSGYYLNGQGSISILHQQKEIAHRKAIKLVLTKDLERILISTWHNVQDEVTISNIQLEVLDWNGYTSSPQKGDWDFIPYGTPFVAPKLSLKDYCDDYTHSYWEGKTINYNGDSVTQGLGSDRMGWVKIVNQTIRPGKVNNYAIGGTRLAHVDSDPNCMVDRYTDMSLDCDIVIIFANTNDYASQVTIGTDDSTDPTTYKGAMNIMFSWLKTNFPTQPIIISTMLTRKNDGLSITIEQYAQAVRDMTAKYGFILYDAYTRSGLDLLNSPRDGSGITNDGLHPNAAGALALGRKLAAFINAQ